MKIKKTTLLVFLFVSTVIFAQNKEEKYPQDIDKKHEVKINTFSLIALSSLNVSYESLIHKNSSFGLDLFLNFNNDSDINFPRQFSLTPYYRWFFSEKFAARGFFVEAFGMLNTQKDSYYNGNSIENDWLFDGRSEDIQVTDFALGISAGGKFITRKNFVAEVYLGIGRNLFNSDTNLINTNIVTRGGISLGYRF
ncbi:DUF3575 domain-containing protein [uncultured Polaribacter sp.]|uniref:DUF3575 domain-containing protein n=1 Tax=uncultured Polaribacter sp. TaxID=174711 RepID=UPI00262A171D|nr:DUF3575 domain-containing protein [uncultured Polaribacter sp.]